MKIYRVVDDASKVVLTADRLVMLEALYKLYQKYEDKQSWFWVEEDTI